MQFTSELLKISRSSSVLAFVAAIILITLSAVVGVNLFHSILFFIMFIFLFLPSAFLLFIMLNKTEFNTLDYLAVLGSGMTLQSGLYYLVSDLTASTKAGAIFIALFSILSLIILIYLLLFKKIKIILYDNEECILTPFYVKFILFVLWILSLLVLYSLSLNSGTFSPDVPLSYKGMNGSDGCMVMIMAEESFRQIPLLRPWFNGFELLGYHHLYEVMVGMFRFFTPILPENLVFKLFPITLISILVLFIYELSHKLLKNYNAALIAVFIVMLGSDLGYVTSLFTDKIHVKAWEQIFLIDSTLNLYMKGNNLFALLIMFTIISLLVRSSKLNINKLWFLSALLLGLMSFVKIHTFAPVFCAFLSTGIYIFINKEKNDFFKNFTKVNPLFGVLAAGILALFIMHPHIFKSGASSSVDFWPTWLIWVVYGTLNGYSSMDNVFTNLNSFSWLKVITAFLVMFFIWIIGAFWIRIIGISFLINSIKRLTNIEKTVYIFIGFIIGYGFLLSFCFLLQEDIWNSMYFLSTASFPLLSIMTAGGILVILNRVGNNSTYRFYILILLLSLVPNVIQMCSFYINNNIEDGVIIKDKNEVNMIKYIRTLPQKSVLLVDTENTNIGLLSLRRVVIVNPELAMEGLIDENIINDRINAVNTFFSTNDKCQAIQILKHFTVSHVYTNNKNPIKFDFKSILVLDYSSNSHKLYKLDNNFFSNIQCSK